MLLFFQKPPPAPGAAPAPAPAPARPHGSASRRDRAGKAGRLLGFEDAAASGRFLPKRGGKTPPVPVPRWGGGPRGRFRRLLSLGLLFGSPPPVDLATSGEVSKRPDLVPRLAGTPGAGSRGDLSSVERAAQGAQGRRRGCFGRILQPGSLEARAGCSLPGWGSLEPALVRRVPGMGLRSPPLPSPPPGRVRAEKVFCASPEMFSVRGLRGAY